MTRRAFIAGLAAFAISGCKERKSTMYPDDGPSVECDRPTENPESPDENAVLPRVQDYSKGLTRTNVRTHLFDLIDPNDSENIFDTHRAFHIGNSYFLTCNRNLRSKVLRPQTIRGIFYEEKFEVVKTQGNLALLKGKQIRPHMNLPTAVARKKSPLSYFLELEDMIEPSFGFDISYNGFSFSTGLPLLQYGRMIIPENETLYEIQGSALSKRQSTLIRFDSYRGSPLFVRSKNRYALCGIATDSLSIGHQIDTLYHPQRFKSVSQSGVQFEPISALLKYARD